MEAQVASKDAPGARGGQPPGGGQGGGQGGSKGGQPGINAKALITRNLRLAYDEVASEPIPQHFLDLLNQLDEAKPAGEAPAGEKGDGR